MFWKFWFTPESTLLVSLRGSMMNESFREDMKETVVGL